MAKKARALRPDAGKIKVTVGRVRPLVCDATGCQAEPAFGFPHDRLVTAWLCHACAMQAPAAQDMRDSNADRVRKMALEGVE